MKYIARTLWTGLCLLPVAWMFYLYFLWEDPGPGNWDIVILISGYVSSIALLITILVIPVGLMISSATSNRFYSLVTLAPVLCFGAAYISSDIERQKKRRIALEKKEFQKRNMQWIKYDDILIPHIIEYVQNYPDRIKFPFSDDRAEIEGLIDYLKIKEPEIPYSEYAIRDPWGEDVLIIIDREDDMKLQFADEFYGVYNKNGNELVVALYSASLLPYQGSNHLRWQLEGGCVEKTE